LTCIDGFSSPISSKKSVPVSASSKRPLRAACAPVNAPRSWPNSSDSMSVSGSAAQLTAMNGPAARALSSWRARAMISLPVPFSPVMSTVALVSATARACLRIFSSAGALPTKRPKPRNMSSSERSRSTSSSRRRTRAACATMCLSSASSKGFSKKP
jgi:hypothetical protein